MSEEITIPSRLKVDQLQMLDLYFKAAEKDPAMIKFIENLQRRIDTFLKSREEED